jgi:uncharacterized protein YjbJ (UPF0337 family)
MVANNDKLQGRWHELKGHLRRRWGKLTEDDISKLSGKQEDLAFALRRRYGYAEGQAVMEIHRWISDYDRDNVRARK